MKYLLACICLTATIATAGETQLIKRPTDRVTAEKNASECRYVESVWGSPCRVKCEVIYVPMFFGTNRIVHFRLNTDRNDLGPTDSLFDFSQQESIGLSTNYAGSLRWVEWFDREPGQEFNTIPLQGCYCNEIEGVVYICIGGRLVEIVDGQRSKGSDDEYL
jgi:hypothetical protein